MNWTDQHSANLGALLNSTPLLARLAEHKPKYEGATIEEKAMSASAREGYERCMDEITAASEARSFPSQVSPFIANLEKFEERPFGAEQ